MLLTDIQANTDALVRSSDIDQLPPELRDTFWHWMRGQTMLLIDGEAWVYPTDWQRFMHWYEAQAHLHPDRSTDKS